MARAYTRAQLGGYDRINLDPVALCDAVRFVMHSMCPNEYTFVERKKRVRGFEITANGSGYAIAVHWTQREIELDPTLAMWDDCDANTRALSSMAVALFNLIDTSEFVKQRLYSETTNRVMVGSHKWIRSDTE